MTKLALAKPTDMGGLERVLVEGDLGGLTTGQRESYYLKVCESVGLNPLTQPFEYLKLQGKTILYARRACTDQLRKIHGVSVAIVNRERMDGVYVVTARATTPDGRCDESIGAVPLDKLQGENLANALMKAETKAKRRVTLAICGLSMLDEAELDGVRNKIEPPARKTLDDVEYDRATGEVEPPKLAAPTQQQEHDEYGLPIPTHPCPVFTREGSRNKGKRWDEVQPALIEKMYTADAAQMSQVQRDWAEYIIARRGHRKADEAEKALEKQIADDEAREVAAEKGE